MKYLIIEFTKGLECMAYQEIQEEATLVVTNPESDPPESYILTPPYTVIRYTDLEGNTLDLPAITESRIVTPEYVIPEWANV